jgi:hypothetical protein
VFALATWLRGLLFAVLFFQGNRGFVELVLGEKGLIGLNFLLFQLRGQLWIEPGCDSAQEGCEAIAVAGLTSLVEALGSGEQTAFYKQMRELAGTALFQTEPVGQGANVGKDFLVLFTHKGEQDDYQESGRWAEIERVEVRFDTVRKLSKAALQDKFAVFLDRWNGRVPGYCYAHAIALLLPGGQSRTLNCIDVLRDALTCSRFSAMILVINALAAVLAPCHICDSAVFLFSLLHLLVRSFNLNHSLLLCQSFLVYIDKVDYCRFSW